MAFVAHPLARCCWCSESFVKAFVDGLTIWVCPTAACRARQTKRSMQITVGKQPPYTRFVPLPRQVEAFDAVDGPATYVLFGGARGGAKSKAMREIAHRKAMQTPHLHMILLRRTYKELEDNHLLEMEVEAPTLKAEYVPSLKLLRYPNGSTLRFGHCETSRDVTHYLSSEYDLVIFDELVTFEFQQFLLISTSARTRKEGVTPKIIAGTNPGGPQSHWVRSFFIDKTVDTVEFPQYDPHDYQFIPSKLEDNPYLDKAYEKVLLALPPELRRAYRDGDWDIFPGQYFPEWRKRLHVTEQHRLFPSDFQRVLSFDWGFVKPGVCAWWVLLPDGHAYREQEYVFTRTTAIEVGKEIARRCKDANLTRVSYLVYDTAMEIPQNDSGESTIETVRRGMRAGGFSVPTRPADKDRLNGWQRLRHWLGMAPDGQPWLQSSPHCGYFNRTIPSLVSDENNPEDVDTNGEDHAADEARYFVMSRPAPSSVPSTTAAAPFSIAWVRSRFQKKPGTLTRGRHAA